jgi:LacI family transcriptional regulator
MAQTLEQIAALAGVSRSTVSRVINDHPSVDAETRARVWQVVHEHNFQPNSAARALVRRRSQIIGLIIPQALRTVFTDTYFPALIQGIAAACE